MERLVVGLVRSLHGLEGAVRVEPLTDRPERFAPGSRLAIEGETVSLTVAWSQDGGRGLLLRFEELSDRAAVEPLRGRYLEAAVEPAALPSGAFWWHELEGVPVTTTEGVPLGEVVDVFRAGGAEVLVVRGVRGELYVPAVGSVVRDLAPHEGRIVIDAEALGLTEEAPRRPRGRRSSRAARSAGSRPREEPTLG
ncbi:MAG: ribosome maturation factor RimM [Candidatus Limnocylindrales bacterium]